MKTTRMYVRMTEKDKADLRAEARRLRITVSALVLMRTLGRAA